MTFGWKPLDWPLLALVCLDKYAVASMFHMDDSSISHRGAPIQRAQMREEATEVEMSVRKAPLRLQPPAETETRKRCGSHSASRLVMM